MLKTINVPRASESLGNIVSKLNQTYKEKEMKTFKSGDRVQVFNLKKFAYLGWGIIESIFPAIKSPQESGVKRAVFVRLDDGKGVYVNGTDHIALSKDEAIEIANRILEDIEKAKD